MGTNVSGHIFFHLLDISWEPPWHSPFSESTQISSNCSEHKSQTSSSSSTWKRFRTLWKDTKLLRPIILFVIRQVSGNNGRRGKSIIGHAFLTAWPLPQIRSLSIYCRLFRIYSWSGRKERVQLSPHKTLKPQRTDWSSAPTCNWSRPTRGAGDHIPSSQKSTGPPGKRGNDLF